MPRAAESALDHHDEDTGKVTAEHPVSFEEYRLYFESAERVTERRQATNRFNYSISVAVLLATAAVANIALGKPDAQLAAVILVVMLSGLATAFCSYWIAQINDAKQLNNAKFTVLNDMAPLVVFDSATQDPNPRSFRPFEREWDLLRSSDALTGRRTAGRRFLVLRGSSAEYFVPRGLRIIFAAILLGAILVGVFNGRDMASHVQLGSTGATLGSTASEHGRCTFT